MSNYENAIELNGICKNYPGFTLEPITLALPKGADHGAGRRKRSRKKHDDQIGDERGQARRRNGSESLVKTMKRYVVSRLEGGNR